MENNKNHVWKNSLNYGIMTGMVLIIYNVILYIFDLNLNKNLGYVVFVLILIGIIAGTKSLRDKIQGGTITYGRALGSGVLISTIAGIITGIYIYILMKHIDPDIIKNIYIQMEEEMLNKGLPEDQIEMAMNISKKFTTPGMMAILTPFNYAFLGLIFSLITSAFLKKKADPFASAMADVDNNTEENQ